MRITITTDNLELTNKEKELIIEKVGEGLVKFIPGLNPELATATVTVRRHSRWGYELHFDLWLPDKKHLFAKTRKEELIFALTDLRDKIRRQLEKNSA